MFPQFAELWVFSTDQFATIYYAENTAEVNDISRGNISRKGCYLADGRENHKNYSCINWHLNQYLLGANHKKSKCSMTICYRKKN